MGLQEPRQAKQTVVAVMKLGKDTKVTTSLGTIVSVIATIVMGAGLWYNLADEAYVDKKFDKCTAQIEKVEVRQEVEKDRNQKLDTAIQLLSQSVENHDKNMEAFTRALESLRDKPSSSAP